MRRSLPPAEHANVFPVTDVTPTRPTGDIRMFVADLRRAHPSVLPQRR